MQFSTISLIINIFILICFFLGIIKISHSSYTLVVNKKNKTNQIKNGFTLIIISVIVYFLFNLVINYMGLLDPPSSAIFGQK
ncbi:MAG: hypothetical protein CO040_05075 [Candidatus Pacebacteria bacterium CG_4_9_14_0_2_um_filter_36_8]|nr:MAG: hypothetical protein AUK08_03775 [Candidatus Pacebacteria bacterium CG2_30_36_39]PJC42324.1 MAG: hypothetical protein CO040_05075 [Candidatus Pacebacteria bacterium CG_4_9_14_0_2_um_filter_36_8]